MRHLLMHWSTAGRVPIGCQPTHFLFFFFFFFRLFSKLVHCPPSNSLLYLPTRFNAYKPTFHPSSPPYSYFSSFLFAPSLLTPHPRNDNGSENCSPLLFSLHLPPSASIGPPSRTRPANSHPRPALVIKAPSSYTPSLSATTSEP
jgi:hypothetical protein